VKLADEFESEHSAERLVRVLREIRNRQAKIGAELLVLQREHIEQVFGKEPVLGAVKPVVLAKKGTATVTHTLEWKLYEKDDLEVKVTASDPSLTVPATLKLDFEKHPFRFEYEVKGGEKAGEFTVTLTPATGKPVTVRVLVK
jgi:hypothetical protein